MLFLFFLFKDKNETWQNIENMDKNFKKIKGFKDWYKNINQSQGLCLTDDLDSLLSCIVLQKMFNIHILGFCNFNKLYLTNTYKKEKLIGVDYDLFKGKCFGNHVVFFDNPDSINLNKNITMPNYYKKFAGSTLITILSLYKVNLDNLNDLQLKLLLCVDSAFKQHEFNEDLFKYYYKDVLKYPEFVDIAKNTSQGEFQQLQEKFNLLKKIYVNSNGKLFTQIKLDKLSQVFNIDLKLPTENFRRYRDFKNVTLTFEQIEKFAQNKIQVVSSAIVNKNCIKLSAI